MAEGMPPRPQMQPCSRSACATAVTTMTEEEEVRRRMVWKKAAAAAACHTQRSSFISNSSMRQLGPGNGQNSSLPAINENCRVNHGLATVQPALDQWEVRAAQEGERVGKGAETCQGGSGRFSAHMTTIRLSCRDSKAGHRPRCAAWRLTIDLDPLPALSQSPLPALLASEEAGGTR